MAREAAGRHFSIVVCAEGAHAGGRRDDAAGEGPSRASEARLGGVADKVAREIEKRTGKETRSLVLGHLQRGGTPTSFDRLLSLRFGAAAVRLAEEGRWGTMVAYDPPEMTAVPLGEAVASLKTVPVDWRHRPHGARARHLVRRLTAKDTKGRTKLNGNDATEAQRTQRFAVSLWLCSRSLLADRQRW